MRGFRLDFSRRRLLAALLLALAAGWLALPRLLELALVRGLESAGLSGVTVELASIGFNSMTLRGLWASWRSADGTLATADLSDIVIDYSLSDRRVGRARVGRASIEYAQGSRSQAQPWPMLAWRALPLQELEIAELNLKARLRGIAPLQLKLSLQARQRDDGGIDAAIRNQAGELALRLSPGRVASASLDWKPVVDEAQRATLQLVYDSGSGASLALEGALPLGLASQLLFLLPDRADPLARLHAQGRVDIAARLALGRQLGVLDSGRAALGLAGLRLSLASGRERYAFDGSGPLAIQLDRTEVGPIWALTLQPGLRWRIASVGGTGWQASGRQQRALRIASDGVAGQGELRFEALAPPWGQANVTVDRIRLRTGKQGWAAAHLAFDARPADIVRDPIALRQLRLSGDADLEWQGGADALAGLGADARLDVVAGRVAHAGEGEWRNARAQARLQLAQGQITGKGALSLQAQELLAFSVAQSLRDGCGKLTLTLDRPLTELARIVQPLPRTLAKLSLTQGSAKARLKARACKAAGLDIAGHLQLRGASLGWEKASANGVDLELDLDLQRIAPLAGRLQLGIERARIAAGAEIEAAAFDAGLDQRGLAVRRLRAGVFGGELSAGPQTLPRPPSQQPLQLDASDLDLARMLAVIGVDGLSGSGRLSGRLPIAWTAQGPELRSGRLLGQQAGVLRYQPGGPLPDNPGLQALRNFHYDSLDMLLDYSAQGQYATRIRLEGRNPDLYGGHPIRFALDLNGELPGLLNAALLSGDFDRYLLEQLRQNGSSQAAPPPENRTAPTEIPR